MSSFLLTILWAWYKPKAAIVNGRILQGDPHTHNSAQRLRVQKCGVLVWRHYATQNMSTAEHQISSKLKVRNMHSHRRRYLF